MSDMSAVIEPKSDQLNADDLIAGPITVTIRDVAITPGSEQPVSIFVEGTEKAYRPCKSMSRVLVQGWGADAKRYIGRSLTLYRDPTVKWAGIEVGGIRISHMSDIDGAKHMMLTATRGSRKPHKVLPLVMQQRSDDPATNWSNGFIAKLATLETAGAVEDFELEKSGKLAELKGARPDLHERVLAAIDTRKAELQPATPTPVAEPETPTASAPSSFADDDLTAAPAKEPAAQETLLDAVDNGAEQQAGDDPAAAKANEIIGEITAAISTMDVDSIVLRNRVHIDAMEPGMVSHIEGVAEVRKNEIKASREQAKPAQQEFAE